MKNFLEYPLGREAELLGFKEACLKEKTLHEQAKTIGDYSLYLSIQTKILGAVFYSLPVNYSTELD